MTHNLSTTRRVLLRAGLGLAATAAMPGLVACATTGARHDRFFASRSLPIGLQLYTLGEDPVKHDFEGTLERVAAMGYRAIELPSLRVGGAAQARAAADEAGVKITSVHVGSGSPEGRDTLTVQSDVAQLAAALETLGCRDLVMPLPMMPEIKPEAGEDVTAAIQRAFTTSTEPWKRTAALLNERGAALKREGLFLSYHNHDFEFLPVRDTSGWEVLVAETDLELVSFQVDVAWVLEGGLDPIELIESLGSRVRSLHVKDLHPLDGGQARTTEVGNGIIDWNKVLPAAWDVGVRQFYVEQEPPFELDRFKAVARSYDYLSRL